MTNQELQSRAIDVMRFPLAVMVVAIHTYFCEALKAPGNVDVPFSGEWAHELITFFSIVLTDAAVPTFFVMSGFLCFYKAIPETKHWFSWGGILAEDTKKDRVIACSIYNVEFSRHNHRTELLGQTY